MSIALFLSPPSTHLPSLSPPHFNAKTQLGQKHFLSLRPKRRPLLWVANCAAENGSGAAAVVEEDKVAAAAEEKVSEQKEEVKEESLESNGPLKAAAAPEEKVYEQKEEVKEESLESNGQLKAAAAPEEKVSEQKEEVKAESLEFNGSVKAAAAGAPAPEMEVVSTFQDPRWVSGTWDLTKFQSNEKTDWDAVIDAEARRRKWLQDNPESSSNEDPVVFDTSIIPWWAWIKRYHLPEAELLNGRAAMIGFFMAYLVDSLTGVGLVDQMGNFFCKTLLFVAVVGVLVIRKNEDIETVKKLVEESTFYDKQWQATWQEETSSSSKKDY